MPNPRTARILLVAWSTLFAAGCAQPRPVVEAQPLRPVDPVVAVDVRPAIRPGDVAERTGDEIMIAGRLVHTGAPVVLWFDPSGYDAYRVTKRFAPAGQQSWRASRGSIDSPNRYGDRPGVPENGWTPETLGHVVDQIVLHYDAAGVSRSCFKILHDVRGLSIHFMVDLDGTIYQTLDVKERAWHATIANDRSVGIEIANIGAFPPGQAGTLDSWYQPRASGTRITLPERLGDGGIRDPSVSLKLSRGSPISGVINSTRLVQYDFTDAQYESLEKLAAALCVSLPRIRPETPRDSFGKVAGHTLSADQFARFSGILGHFHIQENKIDPGPAFDWERLLRGIRAHMGLTTTAP